ncbi:MAG: alpha/beta hydrolase [Betaproteobacteria bacterium]
MRWSPGGSHTSTGRGARWREGWGGSRSTRPPGRRIVDVWLPRGYDGTRPHAVLYMHDGQMLYDATTTWNQQSWDVAPTVQRLIDAGTLRETIVVGVWNTGPTRFNEYFPQGFVEHVPEGAARQVLMARGFASRPPMADAYLRFLVDELKPAIDARYRTRPGREHTAVAGSSMGGLISLYALCEHPQVFGGAGCLSTHWIGGFERNAEIPAAGRAYLRRRLPAPGGHRIYMDRGTAELDALYDEAQAQVDALMRERGFAPPLFVSRVFEGEGHNERAWARRLETPLRHLLAA